MVVVTFYGPLFFLNQCCLQHCLYNAENTQYMNYCIVSHLVGLSMDNQQGPRLVVT